MKTQRQVIPQKLFSASFNIHTPTIHHVIETQVQISKFKRQVRPCNIHCGIKMQVQISRFKCQVRPYRVTCTRSSSSGNESSNQHSHSNHPYSQHYRHYPPAPTIIAACLSHYIGRVVQNVNLLWCQQFWSNVVWTHILLYRAFRKMHISHCYMSALRSFVGSSRFC